MEAVRGDVAAVNLLRHAAWRHAHGVATIEPWMIDALVRFRVVEMLHQRSTERDVQQLRTAADTQHRQSGSKRRANQCQFPIVATTFDRT